ncbi:MAG: histidine--tRNA ligase [Actinobacteria bacterium]|nr:histidine--tRNA ligase [Actinomycetota bacterium]
MELNPPRGTLDLLVPEGGQMRALYDAAADLARTWGYRYVETPGFESTELFSQTSGETSDVVSKEMYTFNDRRDRSLTLRPEGTAPVMRAYLAKRQGMPSPFKAYYLTRMYRYGRPQAGRYREHRQFGVEVFDSASSSADIEVILLGNAFLRGLGLSKFEVQVNSIGDDACRPAYRDLLVDYLSANAERMSDEHKERYADNPLRVLDCKDEACAAIASEAPRITDHLCDDCSAHFDEVLAGVRAAGLEPVVTPTLVRGLDYYTRTAFEFVSLALSKQQGTLFGGGRYDGLAEALGGPAVPGVGFGMGLERVKLALEDEGIEVPHERGLVAFVIGLGAARDSALDLVAALREVGVPADASFEERPLKAQMRMADRASARFAVIIGEQELEQGKAIIKSMDTGEQETVDMKEAAAWISQRA